MLSPEDLLRKSIIEAALDIARFEGQVTDTYVSEHVANKLTGTTISVIALDACNKIRKVLELKKHTVFDIMTSEEVKILLEESKIVS